MTHKSIIFFTFHRSFVPFVIFTDGSFKIITGSDTVNLTFSLALSDFNYILYSPFNLVYVSCLTKTFIFYNVFSFLYFSGSSDESN